MRIWHPIEYLKQFITNSKVVTEEGKYALDAVQNNPDVAGSLRNELNAISTGTKGYYKIGPFYVYRYYIGQQCSNVKIDMIEPKRNTIFFFGEQGGYPFSGTVSYSDAVVNQGSDNNINVTVDIDNNKIIFSSLGWYSFLNLIATTPITGMEIY